VVAVVIGLIVMVVIQTGGGGGSSEAAGAEQEQDRNPDLPGQWIDPGATYPETGDHVEGTVPFCEDATEQVTAEGKVACYHSNPPTSGPHSGTDAARGIYAEPVPKENLVHNMEHGGVIVWYNCTDCDELVSEIRQVAEDYLRDGRELVMSPYPEMEANTIALTGWSRLDKFPVGEYSEERLRRFIEAHERRFNPEGF
jgi:hypothetical protein